MKMQQITILVKGENELRRMSRKEFIEFMDMFVLDGTTIEIVEIQH